MNKNNQPSPKLTEFAPLPSEEKSQSVAQFFSNFFKSSKPTDTTQTISNTENVTRESLSTWSSQSADYGNIDLASAVYDVDVNEGRSLPNVLKRISNLLALKTNNLQDYADTELKQYWMPDSVSKECYECCEKFTTFRRRHHCRVCGQIFCSQCCNQQIPGKIFGCTGDLRVCTYCCKVVLSYLSTASDLGNDLTADLKLLQENLQTKFGTAVMSPTSSLQEVTSPNMNVDLLQQRKISVGYQEETFASEGFNSTSSASITHLTNQEKCKALQNSSSLRALFEELVRPTSGIQTGAHRYRLKTYTDCFLGSELVEWLIYQHKANTRIQGVAICQALLDGSYIRNVYEGQPFIDGYALYQLGHIMSPEQPTSLGVYDDTFQEEPIWVQQIQESSSTDSDNEAMSPVNSSRSCMKSSSYMLDLNIEANTVYLSRPENNLQTPDSSENENYMKQEETLEVRTSEQREFIPEEGWHNASGLREDNGEKLAYNCLTETYEQHEQSLLNQLLSVNGLSLTWFDITIPLIRNLVDNIRPDKNHNAEDLDIRHYVQFKNLPGGLRTDTKLISGVVCSKNVAHKGMQTYIENPKILLLQCSINYQRTEGRLMSLEPILMQEHEYLRHVTARILAFQPNIVLVRRNVSGLAQKFLRDNGITLVANVKQSILERLARSTEADLVTSVDVHIGKPRLGTCQRFYLKTFDIDRGGSKTLMFFEGLPMSHLGGTVLLRGASKNELSKLKKILSFILFASYNWRLEKSFVMDEYAQPPNSKCEFLDDSKESSPTLPSKPSESMLKELNKDSTITDHNNSKLEIKKLLRKHSDEKFSHGSEEKVLSKQSVDDFTDPLHSQYKSQEGLSDLMLDEKLSVADLPFSNNFRKTLDDTILCISPYLMFSVPYLETESGKKCRLRKFFPKEIYFSEQFVNNVKTKSLRNSCLEAECNKENKIKPLHPFLTLKITSSADSNEIQNMLAQFRACGGRYEKTNRVTKNIKKYETKILNEHNTDSKLDVLDPGSHQRLAVLFCSFSNESNNAPAFCVNPWVVYMDFYGRNDIPLGCFLEKYCFRESYKCPSKSCETPMVRHIRRFVHHSGCVSISLNSFDNEFPEENIVMWTWCTKCQSVSPVVPMSADTWSFSFAKYLELKFYGGIFTRRGNMPCAHSIHHDHYQYFGYKNAVASFKYTPVNIWEISLPFKFIEIKFSIANLHQDLIDDIKIVAQKGYDIYSFILDKLPSLPMELEGVGNLKQTLLKEQNLFKQKVEEIQIRLTSPTVENKDFDEKVVLQAYWKISDALIQIKASVAESADLWNGRLTQAARRRDSDKKKEKVSQSDLDSPTTENRQLLDSLPVECIEDQSVFTESTTILPAIKNIKSLEQQDVQITGTAAQKALQRPQSVGSTLNEEGDGKKESDKKTVKALLSQLLPNASPLFLISNPFDIQEHYTLPCGVNGCLSVSENDLSSIIAYALNTHDYKRSLDEINQQDSGQFNSPVAKRKNPSDKDRIESGDEKNGGLLGFLKNKDKTDLLNSSDISNTNSSQISASDLGDDLKRSKKLHIDVVFDDSNCNFLCRVYYAERFAALRSLVLPMGEDIYMRSLSNSVLWNARGGKSGSTFTKTKDDRFVLKETSKSEVQLFLESATNYFTYMQKCLSTGQPTLLGKIVGIYQIIFKNNNNGQQLRKHVLVMENLFYNRTVSQKFDLKGSVRNRLVVPDNQEGEIVLLDENLLKMTCDSPLYILPHSKTVLTAAIQNDTEFLSSQSVMDYSLLVGLDSDNKELVLGIIDYIRTFTWDKRLETIVKRTGILGGQGKQPTIISPVDYQARFIEAMHRYFLEVPDHWAGLGKGLE